MKPGKILNKGQSVSMKTSTSTVFVPNADTQPDGQNEPIVTYVERRIKEDVDNINIDITNELAAKLANKVDKVEGKELSTNDYTNADKSQIASIVNKVDKVAGKQLSTNDFTDALKSKYDSTSIKVDNKVDKVEGKQLSTNDLTNELKARYDTVTSKVDKVAGKQLSTNDFTNDYKNKCNTIVNKVDKVAGKQLSTNDFTDAYKSKCDTIGNKVDKVAGKQLSTNDYTDADKSQIASIGNKVDKVSGKGLSTNDLTNALKYTYDTASTRVEGKVDKVSGKQLSTNDFTNTLKTRCETAIVKEGNQILNGILNLIGGLNVSGHSVIGNGDADTLTVISTMDFSGSSKGIYLNSDSSKPDGHGIHINNKDGTIRSKNFVTDSDVRLKDNVNDITEPVLDRVLNFKLKTYNYKNSDKNEIGLIAQDLQSTFSEYEDSLIHQTGKSEDDNNPYLGVSENKLVYLLWKAFQEQNEVIERLQSQIDEIKSK